MADRPIIFSAPMVRALLAGRKTQTRRLASSPLARCAAGDHLWVKETWQAGSSCEGPCVAYRANTDRWYPRFTGPDYGAGPSFDYDAHPAKAWTRGYWIADVEARGPWGSSLHMPRWASRLTLVVEQVRVEQLQALTQADALAEGCVKLPATGRAVFEAGDQYLDRAWPTPRAWYADLWDSLHSAAGESWDDDPAVVVLTFRVIRGNIDQVAEQ